MSARASILLLAGTLTACTGLTLGENEPGQSTALEGSAGGGGVEEQSSAGLTCRFGGAVAVDDATEVAYLMQTTVKGGCFSDSARGAGREELAKVLYAVPPGGVARWVLDLSGYEDVRLLFPEDRILVMAETGGDDELRLLDRRNLQELGRLRTDARYHGSRISPSRRFVAVADNAQSPAPIHLIDTATLDIVEIPHGGDWLEAMWLHGRDTLVAIIFYNTMSGEGGAPFARVVAWEVGAAPITAFRPDTEGLWSDRVLDMSIPGALPDTLFSFTWVGISPDDRVAVLPIRREIPGRETRPYQLVLLDLDTGLSRIVDDARGPVGFVPDGSTLVSYRYLPRPGGGSEPALLLVDLEDLATETLPLPMSGGPQYFVSREGSFVVVASNLGDQRLLLYDLDHARMTEMKGLAIDLHELVSRVGHGEVWLVDEGLYRLDLYGARWEQIGLPWMPAHLNILRSRDLLVLDRPNAGSLVFFDPAQLRVVSEVPLPADLLPVAAAR